MYESVRQVHKMDYTVLDLEMTGLAPKRDKVIEIGAVRVRNGEIADTYGTLVRPGMSIPETVVQLTGITDEMAAFHWNCRPVIPCGLRGHSFRGHNRKNWKACANIFRLNGNMHTGHWMMQ